MLRLNLLGGMRLTNDAERPSRTASQPRRLALLAVLAAARDVGVSRDRLLLLFWPDSTTDNARTSLKQALFALRQDAPDLILGTTTLRLNPAAISCDLVEFLDAVDRDDDETAARLYAGPLLDGVHIENSEEFDQWLDRQRDELAQRYRRALERLARACDARRDHLAAANWWRRLVAAEPLNTRWTIGLVEALAAAGDRAGALAHAERFQGALKAELGLAPDPALDAVRERLRSSPPTSIPAPTVLPPTGLPTIPVPASVPVASSQPDRRGRRRPGLWFSALAALGAVVVAFGLHGLPHRARTTTLDQNLIAVMPFDAAAIAPDLRTLGNDLVVLFWMKLTGDLGPRAVDLSTVQDYRRLVSGSDSTSLSLAQALEVAQHLGAGRLIVGAASGTRNHLELAAYLYEVPSGAVLSHFSASGHTDDVASMVDSLATGLVMGENGAEDRQLPQLAGHKPEAVREYLAGMRAEAGGLSVRDDASAHFALALQLDSTMVLAAFSGFDNGEKQPELARIAWARRSLLSRRDRLMLRAIAGRYVLPGWTGVERLAALDSMVELYPEWYSARTELANSYFSLGALAGLTGWERRVLPLYEGLLEEAPADANEAEEMLEATAAVEDTAGVRRAMRLARNTRPAPADDWFMRWRAAHFLGDQAALRRIWSALDTMAPGPWVGALYGIARVSRVDGRGLADADRAVARLRALGEPGRWVGGEAVQNALAAGRYGEWLALRRDWLATLPPLQSAEVRVRDAIFSSAPGGDSDLAGAVRYLEGHQAHRGRASAAEELDASCWLAQWHVFNRQTRDVVGVIRQLRQASFPQQYADCAALLELRLAELGEGNVRAAAHQLDSISATLPWGPYGGQQFQGLYNAPLSEAWLRLGDATHAALAARRRCFHLFCDGVLWPSQILTEARSMALAGDTAAARRAYAQYLMLRGSADGPWRLSADSARTEQRRLAHPD